MQRRAADVDFAAPRRPFCLGRYPAAPSVSSVLVSRDMAEHASASRDEGGPVTSPHGSTSKRRTARASPAPPPGDPVATAKRPVRGVESRWRHCALRCMAHSAEHSIGARAVVSTGSRPGRLPRCLFLRMKSRRIPPHGSSTLLIRGRCCCPHGWPLECCTHEGVATLTTDSGFHVGGFVRA